MKANWCMFAIVKSLLGYLFLLSAFCLEAQQSDARLWLYGKIEKKLGEKWEGSLLIQNRLSENMTRYSQININPEVTLKVFKPLRLVGGFVQGYSKKNEGYFLPYRQIYGGIQWRTHFKSFTLIYRHLFQIQTTAGYNRDKANVWRLYDRNKLSLRYNLSKRITPYVAGEFNVCVLDPGRQTGDISRYRTFLGVNYKLTRSLEWDSYFLFQERLSGESAGNRQFVYGLTLVYFLD